MRPSGSSSSTKIRRAFSSAMIMRRTLRDLTDGQFVFKGAHDFCSEGAPMNAVASYVSVLEDAGKRIVNLDTALDSIPTRDQALDEMVKLFVLCSMLREAIVGHSERLLAHEEVSGDLAEEWVEEARELGENSRRMRRSIANVQRVVSEVEGHRQGPTDILILYKSLIEKMIDLADLMEDVAETQALAAHKPFALACYR